LFAQPYTFRDLAQNLLSDQSWTPFALVSALQHIVSRGDTYNEIINHQSNLAYASK
jgi:hypothetical protein